MVLENITEEKQVILLLEKRAYILKTFALFKENCEIDIKVIKQKISKSTYYKSLLPKILEINKYLTGKPSYIIKPVFLKNGSEILTGLKINPNIDVEIDTRFIVIKQKEGCLK